MDIFDWGYFADDLFGHFTRYAYNCFIKKKSANEITFETNIFNIFDNSNNDNIMNYIPRQFSLTTLKGTYQFNIEILSETSSVISHHIEENPSILQYFIDIDDEKNVLKKIEQLYQGQLVFFEPEELPTLVNICEKLDLMSLLMIIQRKYKTDIDFSEGIMFSKSALSKIYEQEQFQTFTITVDNKDYKCNIFGVLISKVIRDFLSKNQDFDHFIYDCKNEDDEFQPIIDIFNFSNVKINEDNMYSIKEFADDLQINDLSEKVTKIINEYENLTRKIDDNEAIIESVENIFHLLNNINEYSIETVKKKILESFWIKTEEDVQELAAVFLQVIRRDYLLHRSLCCLLIELDKERKASIHLQKLLSKNCLIHLVKAKQIVLLFTIYGKME